jgi:ubiquinone/menaquinone biosynthesis C-methylase UbiE
MLKIMNSAHSKMTAWGLTKIKIADTAIVLDIGCGGGQTLRTLSNVVKHGEIYGVDYSKKAVATSSKKNIKDVRTGKIIVKQASVSSMPFSENFFDVITAVQTHYFWPDLKNDIVEVNRILKSGGNFLLVSELYKINYHMKEYKTPETLRELLLKNGFSNVNVFQSKSDLCLVGIK